MKVVLLLITTMVIFTFTYGCSSQANSEQALEALIEDYPEIERELNKVSPDFKDKIKIPKALPFEVESESLHTNPDFEPVETAEFTFGSATPETLYSLQCVRVKNRQYVAPT